LYFTTYSCYGESGKTEKSIESLFSRKSLNFNSAQYNRLHRKPEQLKRCGYCLIMILQEKHRGALFTVKKQEYDNLKENTGE